MAALVIGGVFLLGMVVAAGYAARTLPAGARVPLNAGVPEYSLWLSKPAGLAAWLAAGVAAFAAFASLTTSSIVANWSPSLRTVLLPCVMMITASAEAGAVISARRRCVAGGALTGTETTEAAAAGTTAATATPAVATGPAPGSQDSAAQAQAPAPDRAGESGPAGEEEKDNAAVPESAVSAVPEAAG